MARARRQKALRRSRSFARDALAGHLEERHAVVREAVDVFVEHGPFVIGVAGDQPMPIIIKDSMHNILDFGVVGPWAPSTPGNQIAAQWWMDQ